MTHTLQPLRLAAPASAIRGGCLRFRMRYKIVHISIHHRKNAIPLSRIGSFDLYSSRRSFSFRMKSRSTFLCHANNLIRGRTESYTLTLRRQSCFRLGVPIRLIGELFVVFYPRCQESPSLATDKALTLMGILPLPVKALLPGYISAGRIAASSNQ